MRSHAHVRNRFARPTRNLRNIYFVIEHGYVLICHVVKEQMNRKTEFLFYRILVSTGLLQRRVLINNLSCTEYSVLLAGVLPTPYKSYT